MATSSIPLSGGGSTATMLGAISAAHHSWPPALGFRSYTCSGTQPLSRRTGIRWPATTSPITGGVILTFLEGVDDGHGGVEAWLIRALAPMRSCSNGSARRC
jgi:hypothetical protein